MRVRWSTRTALWASGFLGLGGCGLVGSADVVVGQDYPKAGAESGSADAGGDAPVASGGTAGVATAGRGGLGGTPATAGAPGNAGRGTESFAGSAGSAGATLGGSAAGNHGAAGSGSAAGDSGGHGGTPTVSGCVELGLPSEEGAAVGLPGDFDHDGNLDLATANNDGTVSVFRGGGDGCLVSKATYVTDLALDEAWWDFPPVLAAGDLDGNGTTDFATTNPDAQAVSVLLGAPGGSFAVANTYPLETFPIGLAVVDWDADEVLDLVVATYAVGGAATGGDSTVVVLPGRGDGSFAAATQLWRGTISGGLIVGDLNHDGRPDVLLGGSTALLHQSDDTVVANSTNANAVSSMSVADLDGDGNLDIVGVEQCPSKGGPQYCIASLGRGDGTFEETWRTECECSRHDLIATGAVTRGTAIDLIRYPQEVYLGVGDGTFLPDPVGTNLSSIYYYRLLALADWNHDELLDIAVLSGGAVTVRLGNGDANFVTGDASSP